jgi:hypothetical protein
VARYLNEWVMLSQSKVLAARGEVFEARDKALTLLKSDKAVEFPNSPARASRRAEGLALDLISLLCLRLLARDRKPESKGIPG